ncbi:hypothetical protein BKA70DRAFT_1465474 [Coprinopsis sp. MPI-PUGE-AT-0042]|nr:hypothetical protein BKA70DRAFT_1465474 [Coprinopsis sp. MPI-PUGE-AT-0042]
MPKPNTQHQQYIPGQPKHNVGAPTRIPSFQSAWIDDTPTPKSSRGGSATSNHTQGLSVAASPQPPPITPGSGSAAFRALRSLLPFGGPGNKNGSNSPAGNASIATPTPIGRTSSFSFGIGRRNGRPAGVAPVMAIERSKSDSQVDTDVNLRRSISLSRLEVATFLEREPQSNSAPMLRTPSPGLPLSLELSTIIEADSSGVLSRHPASSVTSREANTTFEIDPETDASLQLSPSNLTSEVLAAINASDSPSVARDWSRAGQAVIIDADAADSQPISPGVDGEQSFTRNLPSGERSFMGERTSDDTSKKQRQASFLPRLRQPSSSHSPRGSPLNTPTSRRFPTPSPTSPRFPNGTPSPVNPRFPTSPPTTPRTQTAPATPHGSPLRPTFPSPRRTTKSFNPPPTSTPAANRHYTSQKTFTPTAVSSLSVATGAKMMGKSSSSGTNFSSDVNDTFASGSSKPGPSNLTSIGKGRPPTRKNLQAVLLGRESSSEEVVVYPHTEATPYQQVPRIALSSPPSPTRGTSRTDSNARAPVFTPAGRASLDSRRAPSRPYETPRRPSLDPVKASCYQSRDTRQWATQIIL